MDERGLVHDLNRSVRGGVGTGMNTSQQRWILRLAGAGLLIATGAIHLDLYLTGYKTIPTIGWLFLLQVISGFALGALVLTGSRLMAAAGALFCLGTLGGYLLSIWFGLFGFREVRTTAGIVAGVIEVAGFAVLATLALRPAPQRAGAHRGPGAETQAVPHAGAVVAGLSLVALVLFVVALAGAGSSSPGGAATSSTASGQVVKSAVINGQKVLTNGKGLTLYWFAPDTKNKSVCYGACAQYWPPVPDGEKAGPGVTGTLGTIKRTDGTTQATYNGRPLYTYIADSSPGQARGNNVNLNGGLWHVVPVS
jgi:predicted lipoprotein with Yx(FWY)xxD motif